ncbi:MAG: peptidoglycan DD-metalloendopeptidase family protein [Flavobacteriales bacterium]|nr:peptidoglycan DD-metalloendopeptidase family protein [Flavobacteriales bacterium]MCB9447504.1 peptidoglycan DD-metalloendopeptidase family protein [Flavobacteriales bacterium]
MRYIRLGLFVALVILAPGATLAGNHPGSEWGEGKDSVEVWAADTTVRNQHKELLLRLSSLDEADMIHLVDSLLDQSYISPTILASLSHFSKRLTVGASEPEPYPADHIYHNWDTKETHPYPDELSKHDTTVSIVLLTDSQQFVPPIVGTLTSKYGYRDGRNHNGVDIDLHVWDPVHAAFDGVVRIAHTDGGFGRLVVIRHYNGLETFYGHLHRFKVSEGDTVHAGQVIGLGGSSGHSTGSHLHFEMRYKGKPINPAHVISLRENKLISDSVVLHYHGWYYSAYPTGVTYHVIRRGDCLYNIAKRYGMSISRLCELNGIRRNTVLHVGRKLRVSDAS